MASRDESRAADRRLISDITHEIAGDDEDAYKHELKPIDQSLLSRRQLPAGIEDQTGRQGQFKGSVGPAVICTSSVGGRQVGRRVTSNPRLPRATQTSQHGAGLYVQASSVSSVYVNSKSWLISANDLIKKIRNKDFQSSFKNSFSLPFGCHCRRHHSIMVELKLYPYKNRMNRNLSLSATATIPKKCSRRMLFVYSCESMYKFSTEVTKEGEKIAECFKEVMLESSDGNEAHETVIYLDTILPHEELLYCKGICLNVELQLSLLKPRLPQRQVNIIDEDEFIRIDYC